jgi:hypothetical protein
MDLRKELGTAVLCFLFEYYEAAMQKCYSPLEIRFNVLGVDTQQVVRCMCSNVQIVQGQV